MRCLHITVKPILIVLAIVLGVAQFEKTIRYMNILVTVCTFQNRRELQPFYNKRQCQRCDDACDTALI